MGDFYRQKEKALVSLKEKDHFRQGYLSFGEVQGSIMKMTLLELIRELQTDWHKVVQWGAMLLPFQNALQNFPGI